MESGHLQETYAFLVNPASGAGKGERIAELLAPMLAEHPLLRQKRTELVMVDQLSRDALEKLVASSERLFVVGGDGTVSRLLPSIQKCPSPPILGLIPIGTSNDLARALGAPLNANLTDERVIRETIERLLQKRALQLDFFSVNEKLFFCNYFSIGFDARIVRDFDQIRKKEWLKWLPKGRVVNNAFYFLMGLKNAFYTVPPPINISFEYAGALERLIIDHPARAIIVTGLPFYAGGCRINSVARMDDGLFEITVAQNLFQFLTLILTRFIPFLRSPKNMRCHQAERATIELREQACCELDGEHESNSLLALPRLQIKHCGRLRITV